MQYQLDLQQAKEQIMSTQAKLVCIHLPDGLKPEAAHIEQELAKTGARILIWLGSNFGACDLPIGLRHMGIDLMLTWGHNKFHRTEGWP